MTRAGIHLILPVCTRPDVKPLVIQAIPVFVVDSLYAEYLLVHFDHPVFADSKILVSPCVSGSSLFVFVREPSVLVKFIKVFIVNLCRPAVCKLNLFHIVPFDIPIVALGKP